MQGWGSCDPGSIPGIPITENLVRKGEDEEKNI